MSLHTCIGTLIGLLLGVAIAAAETGDLKHPDWHPDGKLLVAEGSCAGSIDLYLIDVEEKTVRLVWDGKQTEGYPRWFSDGKRIAFHQIDDKRESRIFLAELSAEGDIESFLALLRIDDPAAVRGGGWFEIERAPGYATNSGDFTAQGKLGDEDARLALVIDLMKRNALAIREPARIALGLLSIPDQLYGAFFDIDQIEVDATGTGSLGNEQPAIGMPVRMLQVACLSSRNSCGDKHSDQGIYTSVE